MPKLFITICTALLLWLAPAAQAGVKIVVLGSSTAAGAGVENAANAWVNRYAAYLQSLDPTSQVINLAKGGYTTCAIMPTGTPGYQAGEHLLQVDTERNIDKALSYNPGAIIINMPTNDVSNGIPVETQLDHFATIISMAREAGVKVWITTSQPHNFGEAYDGPYSDDKQPDVYKQAARDQFKQLTESILSIYGDRAIDFYTDIATTDGYSFIRPEYDSGDGVHLNDDAHAILFEKVKEKNIPSQIDDSFGGVLANPVYISFGPVESLDVENWNNAAAQNTGFSLSPLIDFAGVATSLSLSFVNGFTHAANNGAASTVWDMTTTISQSNFSSNSANPPVIEFTGLSPLQTYDFSVFASRAASDTRVCIYTFVGENTVTVSLDAAGNTSNTATALDVIPSAQGKVTLTITRDETNTSGFCYINAMKITSDTPPVVIPEGAINVETPGTLASLLTQPVDEITSLVLYGSLNAADIATIMSMTALQDLDMEHTSIVAGGGAYLNGMSTIANVFPKEMFYNNKVIRRVILPATVIELAYHAFMGASELREVRMPNTVETFGNDLFSGCTNLTTINISTGLRTMGTSNFYKCENLTSISFPEGLTVLPGGTFYGCKLLEEVNLPESLTAIDGDWTFAHCNALKTINLGPNVSSIGAGIFYNCWSLSTIYASMSQLPAITNTANGTTPFTGAFKPQYCTLYVPFAAYDTYKSSDVWGGMNNIVSLATITADGTDLTPGEQGLQALATARNLVITGSTPDADLLAGAVADNKGLTTIDLTGVTRYAALLPTANPNTLTYVNADAQLSGDNVVTVAADGAATAANITLQEGYDFACTREFTAAHATFSRYIDDYCTTIVLPFTAQTSLRVERYSNLSDNTITFTDADGTITAGEVCLLCYVPAGDYTFSAHNAPVMATVVATTAPSPLVANYLYSDDLTGKYTLQPVDKDYYFAPATAAVPAFTGYATFASAPAASYLVAHDSFPTGVESTAAHALRIYTCDGNLYIASPRPCRVAIYSIDGRCVRNIAAEAGTTTVTGLQRGIYIAAGHKVALQ